jgi:type IV fimbrial biogenesis protein FimT
LKHLPSPSSSSHSIQKGFTLVELVVTIAILAILTTLAVPGFGEMLRQWQRDNATRELALSMQIARSEAIKTSRQIVVCPSLDGIACVASTEWRNGWMVFVDDGAGTTANANNQSYDAGERVLKVVPSLTGLTSLTSSEGVQVMLFLPNGLMASPRTVLTVNPYGATSATKVTQITVSRVGRVTEATVTP